MDKSTARSFVKVFIKMNISPEMNRFFVLQSSKLEMKAAFFGRLKERERRKRNVWCFRIWLLYSGMVCLKTVVAASSFLLRRMKNAGILRKKVDKSVD